METASEEGTAQEASPEPETPRPAKGTSSAKGSKCSVCHKSFSEPKLLPCGHLLCRTCLLSWLKKRSRATCPFCRYPIIKDGQDGQAEPSEPEIKGETLTEDDKNNSGIEDDKLQALVDGFPTDLAMEALVKAEQLLSNKKHKCHVCEKQATSLCLQCGDTLCGPCKNVHGKLTVSRHHAVEDLSTLKAERLADFQHPSPCPQHPEEPCRLFCPGHATSLCLLCASSRHRGCEVKEFEQQVEEAKTVLAELAKVMGSGETDIDAALTELEGHLAEMEKRTEAAKAQIRTLEDRLNTAVKDCCHRLELKSTEAWTEVREAVKEAKAVLLGRQARLKSHKAVGQRAHQSKAHDVVCGMTSVIDARVKDLDRHVTLPEASKIITSVTLLVDDNAVLRVEQELSKLGEVKVERASVAANVPFQPKFHNIHGSYIVLSNDNKTAERFQSLSYAIVIVSTPMVVGELTEVHIDKWDTSRGYAFCALCGPILGVTVQAPDTGTVQSQVYSISIACTIIVYGAATYNYSNNTGQYNHVGQGLQNLGVGNRVGVCLDSSFNLHLYINGQDQGIFANSVQQPCYALFDVNDYVTQVTLLPSTKVNL